MSDFGCPLAHRGRKSRPIQDGAFSPYLARKGRNSLKPSLSDEAWQWIKREGRRVTFVRGERLMTEGERASHVYAIASGEVKALAESSSGNPVLLALIGPDQTIGLLSAFDRGPREFTAIARNNVTAWILTGPQYGRMLIQLPSVGAAQLEAVATRFRMSMRMSVERSDDLACRISRQLQTMSTDTSCERLAADSERARQLGGCHSRGNWAMPRAAEGVRCYRYPPWWYHDSERGAARSVPSVTSARRFCGWDRLSVVHVTRDGASAPRVIGRTTKIA